MASNTEFSVANLEFDTIKSNLINYLSGQSTFADYDFTGSNLNVLLDVLAYNTYYNNIYLNHVASEMFLDSAQLRDSVYSISKALNYLPRSYRSSVAYVTIDVNPTSSPHSITIPRLTEFTTTVDNNTYTFSTNNDIVVYANNGYIASNVAIYEGTIVQEAYTVANNQTVFYINNFDVDISSLTVKIRTSNTDSTNSSYSRANSLFGLTSTSNVFFVEPASNGSYNVVFGNGTFGRSPSNNNIIELTYRVSSGSDPNGANSFSASQVAGHDAAVSLVTRATNGDEYQSLTDVKFAAPRSLSVQERAVTKEDYKILIENEFPDIVDTHVFGGEDLSPPEFGSVIVTARSDSYDVLPNSLKNNIINFIKPKSPIGVRLKINDPDFINIEVDTKVKFNRNLTTKTSSEINTLVSNTIVTFNSDNLNKFDRTFRRSKLVEKINECDTSILSNETSIRMSKPIQPEIDTAFSTTLNFNNEFLRTNPINPTTQDSFVIYSKPTISSETFTFNSVQGASLRDNGNGALQIVTANTTDLTVLKANVGSVSYTSGQVTITGLVVNAFSNTISNSIRVYAIPNDPDIKGVVKDIIRIRTSETKINVIEERE